MATCETRTNKRSEKIGISARIEHTRTNTDIDNIRTRPTSLHLAIQATIASVNAIVTLLRRNNQTISANSCKLDIDIED
jgi:hypothetical protein